MIAQVLLKCGASLGLLTLAWALVVLILCLA